jgi:RimJ/RimL family protein N-acetyltransferase
VIFDANHGQFKTMTIPTLATERLIMRDFRADDIDAMASIYSDEDVARFITMDGKPQSRENAWRSMATMMGHRALRGYGMWAVEEKTTSQLIGFVGPHFPEGWPGQEIGWAIAKTKWGLGYATEAARASLDYAFKTLRWPRAIHIINPLNTRSIVVAEKIGSRKENVWIRDGKELLIYAQTNPNA